MASWNSSYAIWRDLSLAQGPVPAEIGYTVAHGERPPREQIVEETEEHFYTSYCSGDGTSSITGPDINLISTMLAEVRQDPEHEQTVEKEVPSTRSFTANMFRRKTKTSTDNSPTLSPTQETAVTSASDADAPSQNEPRAFVPTPRAAGYYIKFYERSKDLDKKKETIWDRIERQIKEIDEKRRRKLMAEEEEIHSAKIEAEGITSTKAEGITSTKTKVEGIPSMKTKVEKKKGPQGIDRVRLAEHRHKLLTDVGDCVVCAAFYKVYPELMNGVNVMPLDSTPLEPVPSDSTLLEPIPNESTPLEPVPSDSTPLELIPSDSTPFEPVPSDSTLLEFKPRDSTPLEPIPSDSAPLESIPSDSMPLEPVPSDSTLLEFKPRDSTPLEPIPSDSAPLESILSDSMPLEPVPNDSTPLDQTPSELKL